MLASLLNYLDPAFCALPPSEAGPGGPRAVTALPIAAEFRVFSLSLPPCENPTGGYVASPPATPSDAWLRARSPNSGPKFSITPRARTSSRCKRGQAQTRCRPTSELPWPGVPMRSSSLWTVVARMILCHAWFSCPNCAKSPRAPELLPFVRMFYGRPSTYSWWDDAGRCREVRQGEGCEQGDPLTPALYALGQHEALCRAASSLHAEDTLMAFLDDLYIDTVPSRAREALDTTTQMVSDLCGIGSNLGKTRVLAAEAGPPPSGIAELGAKVWRGDRPPCKQGVVVLGTPVGHPEFVRAWIGDRLQEERKLLAELPQLPDLQCAWLLLLFCGLAHSTAHTGSTICAGA